MTDPNVRADVAMFLAFLNNAPGPKLHELSAPEARMVQNAMRLMRGALSELEREALHGGG